MKTKDESEKNNEQQLLIKGGIISVLSFIAMVLAQIPSPNYLNPLGMCFATIWIIATIFTLMRLGFYLTYYEL